MRLPQWLSLSFASSPGSENEQAAAPDERVYHECIRCGTATDAEAENCPECGGTVHTYRW
jgi:hypothetical protein